MSLASLRRAGARTGCLVFGLLMTIEGSDAAIETLTLYQKVARASLIVQARSLSDSTRRPQMEVVEVLKGSYPDRSLAIVPHSEDHSRPTPWLKRETFRKGEGSILFLLPYVDDAGRDEGPSTFSLLHADQGKLEVPAEGGEALLDALRQFVAIVALQHYDRQAEALRALLEEKNPYLVEAGLAECRRFRLAEPGDTATLFALLGSRRADFRSGALALLGQIVADEKAAGRPDPPARRAIFERVAASARLDADPTVRLEAVASLEAFDDAAALSVAESVGRTDASQDVRYRAQVAAVRIRQKAR